MPPGESPPYACKRQAERNLIVDIEPKLTESERRPLALHKAVASKLLQDRDRVIHLATKNLAIQRDADSEGRSKEYFDAWESLLKDDEGLLEILTSTSRRARQLHLFLQPPSSLFKDQQLQPPASRK